MTRIWGGVMLALTACGVATPPGSSSDGGGGAGGSAADCVDPRCAPYRCDPGFAVCRVACSTSDDCTEGNVCEDGACVGTDCRPETAGAVCAGYACVAGRCSPDCALGACASGFYCRGDTGECVPRCTELDDPGCAGFVCDVGSGECESYCLDGELPCAPGYLCDEESRCSLDAHAAP